MKTIIVCLSFALMIQIGYAQKEISGVIPAKTISIATNQLSLNGAGLREIYFFDLYVGSLYVTTKSTDASKIINTDESMAIILDIVSGLVSSEKMIHAIDEGFEKSTNNNIAPFKDKIESFKAAFKEEIMEGDHFVIAYIKGSGTEIHKNGKRVTKIEGLDFKKALFGIWFCNNPADESLKEGMLGLN